MDLLDRKDFCISPWTEYAVGRDYTCTCCWDAIEFMNHFEAFKGGPWGGQYVFENDDFFRQRERMIESGSSACASTCPYKNSLPSVRSQFSALVSDDRSKKKADDVLENIRSCEMKFIKPMILNIVPTIRCNLECSFCIMDRESFGSKLNRVQMDPYDENVKNLQPLYEDCVRFSTAGGDTFSMSDERIEMFYSPFVGKNASLGVTTNGVGLTLRRYEKFFVSGMITAVTISMASLKNDVYEIMYSRPLSLVMNNIKDITGKYKNHKISTISYVVTAINVEEMPSMVLFAESVGINHVVFLTLNPVRLGHRGYSFLDPMGDGFSLNLYRQMQEAKVKLYSLRKTCKTKFDGLDHISDIFENKLKSL